MYTQSIKFSSKISTPSIIIFHNNEGKGFFFNDFSPLTETYELSMFHDHFPTANHFKSIYCYL